MNKLDGFKDDARVWALDAKDKASDLVSKIKISDYLSKKEDEHCRKKALLWVLAVIGAIAAVAAIAYAVYRFVAPDYLEDYDDYDFDEEFADEDVEEE